MTANEHSPESWGDAVRPLVERFRLAACTASLLLFPMVPFAQAAEPAAAVAVIYPDVAEPYRSVFSQIIEGITEKTGAPVVSIPLGTATNPEEVSGALRFQNVHTIFALGRNGLKMAGALGHEVTVIGGCVISVPEGEAAAGTIFSLAPDPSLLFTRLKALKPEVARVHVVYEPGQSGWLIRRAQAGAQALGIKLLSHEAPDLKTALHLYQDILTEIDPKRDALWLPQDTTTVEETTVLPLVLQEAWNRELALVSSNVAHVKRGALFSLYPDTRQFGRHLASFAAGAARSPAGKSLPEGLVPLTDVLMAVNVRTAAHLGMHFSDAQMRSFSLVFPEN